VILTEKARHFVDAQKLGVQVHTDEEEWVRKEQSVQLVSVLLHIWSWYHISSFSKHAHFTNGHLTELFTYCTVLYSLTVLYYNIIVLLILYCNYCVCKYRIVSMFCRYTILCTTCICDCDV